MGPNRGPLVAGVTCTIPPMNATVFSSPPVLPAAVPRQPLSRNAVIALGVVALHAGLIWALQSGLAMRAAEVVVPVEILSQLIEPPAPKVEPVRPPPAPPTPPAPVKKATAPVRPAPQPPALTDPTPSPNAPTSVTPPPAPPAPVATPVAAAPVAAAPVA